MEMGGSGVTRISYLKTRTKDCCVLVGGGVRLSRRENKVDG